MRWILNFVPFERKTECSPDFTYFLTVQSSSEEAEKNTKFPGFIPVYCVKVFFLHTT